MVLRLAAQPDRNAADPEEHAVTAAERGEVIDAMNRLDRDDRLVIALRHFEQLSENEMAEVLGAPMEPSSPASRAMSRLRAELVDKDPIDEDGER